MVSDILNKTAAFFKRAWACTKKGASIAWAYTKKGACAAWALIKKAARAVRHFLRELFLDLSPLVGMQLKEKADFSFLQTKKKTITKVVFTILGFVAVTGVCYGFFFLASALKLFSLTGTIPPTVLSIVFAFMFVLSTLSCTAGLVNMLYFAKDNHMLLTLPVTGPELYVSKLLVFYLYELKRNASFMVPLFLAYGIVSNLPFGFYPWMILMFLFVSMLPVLAGAILSIPAMWIYQQMRQFRWLQAIIYAAVIGAAVYGLYSLILLIPEDLNLIAEWGTVMASFQDMLAWFETNVRPLYLLTLLITGKKIGFTHNVVFPTNATMPGSGTIFLSMTAIIVVLFILGFLLAKPLFFRMASQPFEYRKRNIDRDVPNRTLPGFLSAAKKEAKLAFRTPSEIFTNVVELFGLPLMLFLLNRLYRVMESSDLGNRFSCLFNILLMLLFMLSANVMTSSVYSREGRAAYFNKVPPTNYYPILLSKLYIRIVVQALTAAAAVTVFYKNSDYLTAKSAVLLGFALFFFATAHLFWSAEMDIMNPQTEQYGSTGEHSHNPNETLSSVFAILIPALVSAIFFFLQKENASLVWVKLFFIGFCLFALKIFTYLTKIRLYYKEK